MADNPRILNFYHLLNYRFNIPEYQRGYRWEKKQVVDLMNDLKDFIDSGVLSQVLENPENVSKNTLSGSNLPSTLKGKKNNSLSKEIKNKCVNALYAGLKFGNYNNPEKNTVLKYELEYIISGKDSDKENLASVVEKIVLAKTGIKWNRCQQ